MGRVYTRDIKTFDGDLSMPLRRTNAPTPALPRKQGRE